MSVESALPVRSPSPGLALFGVIAASVGFGLVPLFARGLTAEGMAPHAIAFCRYVVAAVAFAPALVRGVRTDPRAVLWGMAAGAAMGLGWIGYVIAVARAPVATVSVLYMTYPVFTLVIGTILFRDRPAARALIAAVVILLAAGLAIGPAAVPPALWPVLLLSLAAPAGFGLGINVLVHRLTGLAPFARIAAVSAGSIAGLLPLVVMTPAGALVPASAEGWWLVAGIALGSALLPQLLYTVCAPAVGAARTAVAGSVELPTMLLTGWLLLGESLQPAQLGACAMVLAAIALTPGARPRTLAAPLPGDR